MGQFIFKKNRKKQLKLKKGQENREKEIFLLRKTEIKREIKEGWILVKKCGGIDYPLMVYIYHIEYILKLDFILISQKKIKKKEKN